MTRKEKTKPSGEDLGIKQHEYTCYESPKKISKHPTNALQRNGQTMFVRVKLVMLNKKIPS